jgi:hypothetical protein
MTFIVLIFSFLICLVLFAVIGICLVYLWDAWQNCRPGRTVYVGSNRKIVCSIVPSILEKYAIDPSRFIWVEPGAGMGEVSGCMSSYPWKEMHALEIGTVLFCTGKLLSILKKWPLHWQKGDVLKMNWPRPAVVYCYLFTEVITRMYKGGQFKNSLVMTLTFPIEGVEPTETIPVSGWQQQIFIYDLRDHKK